MSAQTCEALVVNGVHQERMAIKRPKPGPHQLLIRSRMLHRTQPTVRADATVPRSKPNHEIIVQCLDNSAFGDGAVLGCDFVGTVEEIGEAVQRYSTGETVACLIWGGKCKSRRLFSTFSNTFQVRNWVSVRMRSTAWRMNRYLSQCRKVYLQNLLPRFPLQHVRPG